ncbi:hypothetical protein ACIHFD_44235 [Nonomuraea sp. NPDC051941]|uniref:hypothetical protein n=1 Tax=Nonomuraea sp. NPDC051941 TaxID=3364373 RepID=UPI0037CAECE2
MGELADPAAAALSHDAVEELIDARGRELLRQLLQDHLDLRAAGEERALSATVAGSNGLVDADGVVRRRVEKGHHRRLATIFGTVTVSRCALRAAAASCDRGGAGFVRRCQRGNLEQVRPGDRARVRADV